MIPLLKRLGFIDESNAPLAPYREYRDSGKSRGIMAQQIRTAYKDLFLASEYAYKLKREEIISKLNTLLGTPADDPQTPKVASTFLELSKLADFDNVNTEDVSTPLIEECKPINSTPTTQNPVPKLGISYTINLNLPATNDVEVFNAIFKALKEHLLR